MAGMALLVKARDNSLMMALGVVSFMTGITTRFFA
jgi:hypothetical protein